MSRVVDEMESLYSLEHLGTLLVLNSFRHILNHDVLPSYNARGIWGPWNSMGQSITAGRESCLSKIRKTFLDEMSSKSCRHHRHTPIDGAV